MEKSDFKTCSDCKNEFEIVCCNKRASSCACYDCEHCFQVSCEKCAADGYQWICKKCQVPSTPKHVAEQNTPKTEPKTIKENSYDRVSDRITALSKYVRILQVELERVKSQIDLLSPLGEPLKNTTNDIDSDDISDCSNSLSDFGNDSDSDDDCKDECEDDSDNDSDNESHEKLCLPKRDIVTKVYHINLNFN